MTKISNRYFLLTSFSRLWTMVGSTPPSFPPSTVSSLCSFLWISLSMITSNTHTVLTHMSGLFLVIATAILVATLMWWLGEHTAPGEQNTQDKLCMDQYLNHGCEWSATSFDSSPSLSTRLSSIVRVVYSTSEHLYTCTCNVYTYMYIMSIDAHTVTHTNTHTQINTINSPLRNFFDNNWTTLQLLSNKRVPLPCKYEEQDYEHLTMCCHGNCTLKYAHLDNTTSQLHGQTPHGKKFIYRYCACVI